MIDPELMQLIEVVGSNRDLNHHQNPDQPTPV